MLNVSGDVRMMLVHASWIPAASRAPPSSRTSMRSGIGVSPPRKAAGTDMARIGRTREFGYRPAFQHFAAPRLDTRMLQQRETIGTSITGTPEITSRAVYVEPPPNPTLE